MTGMNDAAVRGVGDFVKSVGFPIAAYIGLFAYMFFVVNTKHDEITELLRYNQAVIIANFYSNNSICLNAAEQGAVKFTPQQIESWKRRCEESKKQMEQHLLTFRVSKGG